MLTPRHFQPDIVKRIRHNVPLTPYDRSTFYLLGPKETKGYTDYPNAPELEGKQ